MKKGNICVSICASTAGELAEKIDRATPLADVIEIRFDCLASSEIDAALNSLPRIDKQYLITFRPRNQGGARKIGEKERSAFWAAAIEKFLESDVLFDQEVDWSTPYNLPKNRIILSFHDFGKPIPDLEALYPSLTQIDCLALKLAISADSVTDAVSIWKLMERIKSEGRSFIPIAMGEAGKWTRILSLAHGGFMTYAALDEGSETAPGQLTAEELLDVYRVKELGAKTEILGVIAGDTRYSMSPYIQNAAFKSALMDRVFVPLQADDVETFIRRMVCKESREIDLNFRGFAVTNPHKEAIIEFLDEIDETARAIGAVNTVKIENDRLIGFNTDADGFIRPLVERMGDLKDARVAIVGAGGAARACAYSLKRAGSEVMIYARDITKAKSLADEFGSTYASLTDSDLQLDTDILVNATPLGTLGEKEHETIVPSRLLTGVKLVYDLTYNPRETRLLREARETGCETLDGLEMLLAQGAKQFEIWTGQEPDLNAMRTAATKKLTR